jgi:four helix bundle protein
MVRGSGAGLMKDRNTIYQRTFEFACRVVRMERNLARNKRLSRNALAQLVQSALSVGSNLEQARAARSSADCHSKLRNSLEEARASHRWLRQLNETGCVSSRRMEPLLQEAGEIVDILTRIADKTHG